MKAVLHFAGATALAFCLLAALAIYLFTTFGFGHLFVYYGQSPVSCTRTEVGK